MAEHSPEKAGVDSSILSLGTIFAILLLLLSTLVILPLDVLCAEINEDAELRRLQNAAEDASTEHDPSGAALLSGRAALMAHQLKTEAVSQQTKQYYGLLEQLLRAQERLYRAMAMFKLGGGQPPASYAVCGMVDQARQMVAALTDVASHVDLETLARELVERAGTVGGEYLCLTEAP